MSVLSLLLVFLPAALFGFLVLHVWRHRRYYYLGHQIPGPPGTFTQKLTKMATCVGPLDSVTKNATSIYEKIRSRLKYPFFKLWLGPKLIVIMDDPDMVNTIFREHLHKADFYEMLDCLSPHSVFFQNHLPVWKHHRSLVASASFNFTALKAYVRIFHEEAKVLADKLEPMAKSGEAFDHLPFINLATFSIIVRSSCGLNMKIQQNHFKEHPFTNALDSIFEIFMSRVFRPWLLADIVFTISGLKKQQTEAANFCKNFIADILDQIKERIIAEKDAVKQGYVSKALKDVDIVKERLIAERSESKGHVMQSGKNLDIVKERITAGRRESKEGLVIQTGKDVKDVSEPAHSSIFEDVSKSGYSSSEVVEDVSKSAHRSSEGVKDVSKSDSSSEALPFETFVEAMLRDQMDPTTPYLMTEEELFGQFLTLISAGFDTTKTTNAFVLNMLAIHPQIQQEVYEEILSVLGEDPDVVPTYAQIQELDLLTRVIKETLRLLPPSPILGRVLTKEAEVAGFTLPVGTTMAVLIYEIHRDPRVWKNPHDFDPDRFLPAEFARVNPNAYMPFSAGPRNCIAGKYALSQMKTLLSTILRRYKVLPGEKCKALKDIKFEFGMTMRSLPGNDIRLERRV